MSLIREIYDRSPLRVLDRSIHGGLGRGNIGVVCAGHGAGKTAFLVSVALDHLMSGDQVLHVAVDQPVDRIRNYYDEIFAEMARAFNEGRVRPVGGRTPASSTPTTFESFADQLAQAYQRL